MATISGGPFGLSCGKLGSMDTMRGRTRHGRATICREYVKPVGPLSEAQELVQSQLRQINALRDRIPQAVRDIFWPSPSQPISQYHTTIKYIYANSDWAADDTIVFVTYPANIPSGPLGNSSVARTLGGGTTIRFTWQAAELYPGDLPTDRLGYFILRNTVVTGSGTDWRLNLSAAARSAGQLNVLAFLAGAIYTSFVWFRQTQPDGSYKYSRTVCRTQTP